MKKIAILTERLKLGFGVDLTVYEQAVRLAKKHKVAVFPIEMDDKFKRNQKFSIFQLHIPLFFNPLRQDWSTLKKYFTYTHLLKFFDTFIIQTPTFNSWMPFLRRFSKVIVCYYGNSPSDNYSFPKNLRKPIFDITEGTFYFRFAHQIVTISHFLKNQLPDYLQKKTKSVFLGTDHIRMIKKQITSETLQNFKDKYFLNKNEFILTYIGRLDYKNNPYKNTKQLLRLNNFFIKKYRQKFRLITIGFPENNIENKFFRHGICVIPNASNKDLVSALSISNACISPSLWEGFNLPLAEGQTVGTPVIAYKTAAHPEIVQDNKTGFLVKTYREFIGKIDYLINNPLAREKMSKNALSFSNQFSWDNNVKQLEKFI